jgi:pimeloyl-ACP methyl ester carboxylesterase
MDSHSPSPLRLLALATLTTALFCGALVWGAAALLLTVATTAGGRWTALAFVLAVPAMGAIPFAWGARRRREPMLAALGVLLALGGLALGHAVHIAPDATAQPDAPLRSIYLGEGRHLRTGLANLVPEVDQFTLGSYLVPFVDPFLDDEQTVRVRELFQGIYGDLAADPAFAGMGSAMGHSYRELFGRTWDVGHLYVYEPRAHRGEPMPVLVFLHGWGGPFLGYQWVLQRFAEQRGYAVVAPSFGMGWWRQEGAMPTVARALEWIDQQPELDGERMILAGLSNGGPGVQKAAMEFPERWDGVVFLSAVMELDGIFDLGESLAERGTPVLVITGDAERRIPLEYTQAGVESLRMVGAETSFEVFPGEDHFLLFSQPAAVMDRLGAWAEEGAGPRDTPSGTRPPPDPGS